MAERCCRRSARDVQVLEDRADGPVVCFGATLHSVQRSWLYDRVVLLGLGGRDVCQTAAAVAVVVLVSSGHVWARKMNGLLA